MIAPARLAAYETLRAVDQRSADLPAALARARTSLPDERDRALAGEIATGTLRWQAAFDRVIAVYAGRPLERLDAEVVLILRLTLFQLLHLDRVPASAAVNDAVQLTRKVGKSSSSSFVNAILRRASRERSRLPLPVRTAGDRDGELDYLATTLSHPRWLVERWRRRYGFDAAEAWCRFNNAAAPLTLRANRLRVSRDVLAQTLQAAGVQADPTTFAPDGLVIRSGNPLLTPLAGQGLFAVQDEASQLVGVVARAAAGERVLDACAAPGGKTTAMAADMGDSGLLISSDVPAKTRGAAGGNRPDRWCPVCARDPGQRRARASLWRDLRSRPDRRALFGPWDDAARSRYQMAALSGRARRAGGAAIAHSGLGRERCPSRGAHPLLDLFQRGRGKR